jgi:hypothetical protein
MQDQDYERRVKLALYGIVALVVSISGMVAIVAYQFRDFHH